MFELWKMESKQSFVLNVYLVFHVYKIMESLKTVLQTLAWFFANKKKHKTFNLELVDILF